MLLENFSTHYKARLSLLYSAEEAEAITNMVFMQVFACNRMELSRMKRMEVEPVAKAMLLNYLQQLEKGEPVQYVLGSVEFCGIKLRVNSSVLIPRPETEFLVGLISRHKHLQVHRILDVCTGSGCIALAMSKQFPDAEVWAVDISAKALEIAKINAELNDMNIRFVEADILQKTILFTPDVRFDIIVSNPPYVGEKEKKSMHRNVLEYEPAMALFVPDNDPLKFYTALEKIISRHLSKEGIFYAEINENAGKACKDFFKSCGYKGVNILKDIYGRDRYLVVPNQK